MIKPLEEMSREELLETAKDFRNTLKDLHIRFLAGFIMELEAGEFYLSDIDPVVINRLKKVLGIATPQS